MLSAAEAGFVLALNTEEEAIRPHVFSTPIPLSSPTGQQYLAASQQCAARVSLPPDGTLQELGAQLREAGFRCSVFHASPHAMCDATVMKRTIARAFMQDRIVVVDTGDFAVVAAVHDDHFLLSEQWVPSVDLFHAMAAIDPASGKARGFVVCATP